MTNFIVFRRKYATLLAGATVIRVPITKVSSVNLAVGADWTPASGDCKISIDGGAAANATNLPTVVAMGNGAFWEFVLTAAELTGGHVVVTVADAASKAVEDFMFVVETFGTALAMFPPDETDGVRMGLLAIPNVAAATRVGEQIATQNANGNVHGLVHGTPEQTP